MADIKVSKLSESLCFLECPDRIAKELSHFFSVFAKNYRFAPKYKNGCWDGRIRFFNYKNQLPIGLLEEVRRFARLGKYTLEVDFEVGVEMERGKFETFVEDLKLTTDNGDRLTPRDYQMESAYDAITKRHISLCVPTAGGKTLIAYIIARFLEKMGKKFLLIVPNVNLVEQSYGDFYSYGWDDISSKVSKIYAGKRKTLDYAVTISTWQSLQPLLKDNPEAFAEFDGVMVDEAHLSSATVLQSITKSCINAKWRIGLSGTYPDQTSADWYSIVGGLGPIKKFISYKQLQEAEHIANLKIFSVVLKYPPHIKKECYNIEGRDYQKEADFIHNLDQRYEFLLKLVNKLEKNTLVLFTKIEKHGTPLHELFTNGLVNKKLLYVDGSTKVEDREYVRAVAEKRNDIVIAASYGTLSTGFNLKNLHNVIFASGYKSRIKILQSIGRGLRKTPDKTEMKLYDIIDDMSFKDNVNKISYTNFSLKHFKERLKIYEEEGFENKTINFKLNFE